MTDCISRKDAEMCLTADITNMTIEEYISMVGDRLKDLPSIQPKAKTGHWIYRVVGIYRYASCSECNKMQVDESNYCPNCGVKMEGK